MLFHSLILSSLLALLAISSAVPAAGDLDHELQVLLNLKTALDRNSSFSALHAWLPATPKCKFTGISCDTGGAITEIDLPRQGLAGVLPIDEICGNLRSLERLALGSNNLSGRISEGLNRCVRLQYLDLGNNQFTGPVPAIPALNRLRHLFLNSSGFSGAFPYQSLGTMAESLETLSVGDNSLLDPSPFPDEIAGLRKLRSLYLTNCSLRGPIPARIGNLADLRDLQLSANGMSGKIPPGIGKLTNLWRLEIYRNNFTGKLPPGLGNLTNLEFFDASINHLEGGLTELRYMTNLISLQLYENRFSGEVPEEFGDFRRLEQLSLFDNALTGPLPARLGSLSDLDYIDVTGNRLTGPLPPDMCRRGKMTKLLAIDNGFTGEIPATYAHCHSLQRFRVNNNFLSGVVPAGIWGLPRATIIDVRLNRLEGPIAPDIGNAKSLSQLYVQNNRLSGDLPPEIFKASSLVSVDLSNNNFSGHIPAAIGDLKKLGSLHLENNAFSGSIPESVGRCNSLADLNIGHNSISGEIPPSLGSLTSLNTLNLTGNKLAGKIPAKLSSARLSLLDLSDNHLTGPIPPALSIEAYHGSFTGNAGLCCISPVCNFRRCPTDDGMSPAKRQLVACFAVALAVSLLLLACLFHSSWSRKKDQTRTRSLRDETWDLKSFQVLNFTEEEVLDAVKQENLIGKGGSGSVYRVSLAGGNSLAVKHVWNTDSGRHRSSSPMLTRRAGVGGGGRGRRRSREFDAEVEALSTARHVNVVKLVCSITSEDSNLLVYEYMPNGSLWDRLHACNKPGMDWTTRYEIAVGAAKGLEYLHHGCGRPIIHRDVKSSNILLDEFLKPKIADFGLSKIVEAHAAGMDSTHAIFGTPGYFAPEYGYTHRVSEKIDVYSFGVVLMELVTGKRPIEQDYGEDKDIVKWVYGILRSRESVVRAVDAEIAEDMKEYAAKVLRISMMCTATLPGQRPTMRAVVKMLEAAEPCKLVGIQVGKDGPYCE